MSLTVTAKIRIKPYPYWYQGYKGTLHLFFFKLEKKMRSSLVAKGDFAYELKKVGN